MKVSKIPESEWKKCSPSFRQETSNACRQGFTGWEAVVGNRSKVLTEVRAVSFQACQELPFIRQLLFTPSPCPWTCPGLVSRKPPFGQHRVVFAAARLLLQLVLGKAESLQLPSCWNALLFGMVTDPSEPHAWCLARQKPQPWLPLLCITVGEARTASLHVRNSSSPPHAMSLGGCKPAGALLHSAVQILRPPHSKEAATCSKHAGVSSDTLVTRIVKRGLVWFVFRAK